MNDEVRYFHFRINLRMDKSVLMSHLIGGIPIRSLGPDMLIIDTQLCRCAWLCSHLITKPLSFHSPCQQLRAYSYITVLSTDWITQKMSRVLRGYFLAVANRSNLSVFMCTNSIQIVFCLTSLFIVTNPQTNVSLYMYFKIR